MYKLYIRQYNINVIVNVFFQIYRKLEGLRGFPRFYDYGPGRLFNFMIFELLGPSLHEIYRKTPKTFKRNIIRCTKLGIILVDIVQTLHDKNIVHGDIKPKNIATGQSNQNEIYLIDFGLAKQVTHENMQIATEIGTPAFMSLGAHQKFVAYRNDLESLAYTLAFLYLGNLPWLHRRNLKQTKERAELLKILPSPLARFLQYILKMPFTGKLPSAKYNKLRQILKNN